MNEKIVAAAIRYRGKIWSGRSHTDVLKKMFAEDVTPESSDTDMGFLVSDGRFVSREEAAHIAFKGGQTETLKTSLSSCDIWMEKE